MKRSMNAMLLAAAACAAPVALAQLAPEDFGLDEYRANCMVCHGERGKGDGSYGELLKVRAPDLTMLAKRNGGVFPFDRITQTIDGRAMPVAHGSRDMPIWGQAYKANAVRYFPGEASKHEGFVRARILALVDYLNRLQVR